MKETEKRLLKTRLTSAARELSLLGGELDDEAAITQIRNRILSLEQTIQNLCGGVPLKISPSVQFDIYMYKRKGLKNAEIAKKLGVSEITVYTKCNMYEVHTRSRIEEADEGGDKNV